MSRVLAAGTVCVWLLAACGGGQQITSPKTTLTYAGVFAGENGTEAGSFSVSIVVEDSTGTGKFVVNGTSHDFTTLVYSGSTVTASGSGFTFTGPVTDSAVSGTYTSGTGGGLFTGLRAFGATPTSFCGTHIGTQENGVPIAGPFAFVEGNGQRRGVFTSVFEDPFRGVLSSSSSATAVTLDTMSGAASLVVLTTTFTGNYAMASGDTGSAAGSLCRTTVTPPSGSVFDGVIGSFTGVEIGSMNFTLSSTGVGSTGSYSIDPDGAAGPLAPVSRPFLAVISGVASEVAAFDSTYRVIVTLNADEAEGQYSSNGSLGGLVAALQRTGGTTSEAYCGNQTVGNGAFSFLFRSDSTLYGVYTGGSSSSTFQGLVTGKPGDDLAQLETEAGTITVLPAVGSFGGFWSHSASGGTDGTLSGASCP
jgi:hypothetical protein